MECKESVIKSALYPFVLRVVGSEDDIKCFESLIADSSDMAGLCITFTDSGDVPLDPAVYKLEGKTIFEWRRENRALAARVRELESSYDRVIDDKHALMVNLSRALNAKPDYADLHAFIADLEKCIQDISEAVNGAIEVVNAYETK